MRPDDDVAGAAPVVVLSHGAWQRVFGGDPRAVGRQLVMHETGAAHTIVGVMRPGLDHPRGADFWAPVVPNSRPLGDDPAYAELNVLGRLRPRASAAEARAELTAYFQRPEAPAWSRDVHGVEESPTNAITGGARPAVLAFAAAAALLLLITCVNVANLLLVRGLARGREIAARLALGAGRGRIVGQLVTESAILALAGGVLGTALAAAAVRAFVALAPAGTPRLDAIGVNATAIGGAVAITAAVTLLAALVPGGDVASRVELQDALRAGSRQSGAGRGLRRGIETLVVGQVALALLVLSAAGLIGRSLVKLQRVDLAFDPARLLVAELALPYEGFGDTGKQLALLDGLLPRLEALPGVRAVTPVLAAPFVGVGGIVGRLLADGQTADEAAGNPALVFEVVTPSYFATFGVPVRRGRALSAGDREGAPRVAVLSESAARHYWPGADPIGRRLRMGPRDSTGVTIVGVVPDTRYRDLREPRPSIYFPLRQSVFPVAPMTLVIRAEGRPAGIVPAVRRAVGEAGAGAALASAAPFETLLAAPLAQPRLNALLLAAFAAAAVLLAAVGLYGVMATMVRQRTRELGVRMAVGATAFAVGRLVLRRGVTLAAAGTALGVLGALAANRLLAAMLFEVDAADALTLGAVAALLLVVAALASLAPAWSSTRIEPVVALRAE